MQTAPLVKKGYRSEIQGLRGVAVLLVVVYHIWVGKPSGGIDVFLMLSGFFLIGSLSKQVSQGTTGKFKDFLSKMILRLIPSAFLVLVCISIAMLLIMPSLFWEGTIKEVFSSALFYENWQLALNSKDYLAADNAVTPLQHFWSLSIQGQLYIAFFLVFSVYGSVLGYFKARNSRNVLLFISAIFVISFAFALLVVKDDQTFAYFSTFARIWEFTLGGLVALLLPKLKIPNTLQVVMGWVGLIALLLCGVLLDTAKLFPGFATLWPTLATAFILLNVHVHKLSVHRVLTFKPLIYLGDISYALFLWHWPVLIFFLVQSGKQEAGILGGIFVVCLSIFLAAATTQFIDEVFVKNSLSGIMNKQGPIRVALVLVLIVLLVPSAVYGYVRSEKNAPAIRVSDPDYPGAQSLVEGFKYSGGKDVEVTPNNFNVSADVPDVYDNDLACISDSRSLKIITCEYGNKSASRVIALVGGSYSAHWLPAIQEIFREDSNLKVITYLKSSCPLSLGFEKPATRKTCEKWNRKVLSELLELKPEVIISTSTRSGYTSGEDEEVPEPYAEMWELLEENNLNVLAIRDIPRRRYNLSECVAINGYSSNKCVLKKSESLAKVDPTKAIAEQHENVYFADLNEYICKYEKCVPVVGNILINRDHAHLTESYSRTLFPMLKVELDKAMEKFEQEKSPASK